MRCSKDSRESLFGTFIQSTLVQSKAAGVGRSVEQSLEKVHFYLFV